MMVQAGRRLFGMLAAVAIITILFSGCLGGDGGGDDITATLTIDFNGPEGSNHPGNMTIWEKVNGEWVITTESNDGRTMWIFVNLTCEPRVLSLLSAAAELAGIELDAVRYGYMGSFVKAIDGVENESPGRGWQYDVNGEYSLLAADKCQIADGDHVLWRFSKSPW